jgi:hypothetical protein
MLAELQAYADAVRELEITARESGDMSFDKAVQNAEVAERAFRIGREKLRLHVNLHRCA